MPFNKLIFKKDKAFQAGRLIGWHMPVPHWQCFLKGLKVMACNIPESGEPERRLLSPLVHCLTLLRLRLHLCKTFYPRPCLAASTFFLTFPFLSVFFLLSLLRRVITHREPSSWIRPLRFFAVMWGNACVGYRLNSSPVTLKHLIRHRCHWLRGKWIETQTE